MKRTGRRLWSRAAAWGAAVGLMALLTGDGGFTATPPGIDPLEILNLQVKPNVLFVIDTSSSMQLTVDTSHAVGGDDPKSRFYQAKVATRQVIKSNKGRANFGLADFHPDPNVLVIDSNGPLVYVSKDADAAAMLGGFTSTTTTLADYDEAVSAEIFNSFRNNIRNFNQAYPPSCTPGVNCRYYLLSKLFRNDVRLDFDPDTGAFLNGTTAIDCSLPANRPPAGFLGDDTEDYNSATDARPCFQLYNVKTQRPVTFYYSSATIGHDGTNLCTATGIVTDVAKCDADDEAQATKLLGNLQLEVPLDESQTKQVPYGVAANTNLFTLPGRRPDFTGTGDVKAGIRQGQGTPLGAALGYALRYFNGTCGTLPGEPTCAPGVLPSRPPEVIGLQKNFVILLTDGEESCSGNATTAATSLYQNNSDPDDRIETLVVAFTRDISATTANQIARAGSGNTRDAYTATTLTELINALNAAIGETTATGSFSTESSITETVFEYGAISGVTGVTPADPTTRYKASIPVLLQTSFDMPGYTGHLRSFLNASVAGDRDGPGPAGVTTAAPTDYKWDAGEKLRNRVWYGTNGSNGMGDPATATNRYPFAALHASAGGDATTVLDAAALGSALIKRRIYTAPRNGVFPYGDDAVLGTEQQPTTLWPPTVSGGDAVAPIDDSAPGVLDTELGVDSLDLATLQSQFGMCTGSIGGVPLSDASFSSHPCNSATPATVLARARREMRETILAGAAGAEIARDANGDPLRLTADALPAKRGDLLYKAKTWVLAESTLAVPAVVPVPVEARPELHTAEYVLFRDGPRSATGVNSNTCTGGGAGTCVDQGFGLRNPDKNAGAAAVTDAAIKPVMTVVYHATNAMLHAFRGGPRSCAVGACPPAGGEGGGEELWAFVPPDQLGKLRERLLPLSRDPHVYMNASSIRFSDVFVPDNDGSGFDVNGRTFLGRWRTLLFFGRGIGGKHYTAIDVTSAGPYTSAALDANPPALVWNRGNPDTQDGTPGGSDNKETNSNVDLGVTDKTAYATMGQTWSVPAIASVKRDKHFDKEFALFVGSGYSPGNNTEGRTFYVMDALTGDVLYTDTVDKEVSSGPPAGGAALQPNSIVANPSAYVPSQLSAGFVGNPAASQASLVYVGDLHGRLWKWLTSSPRVNATTGVGLVRVKDYGVDQPIANAVGLLKVNNKPHIFLETGNDNRVNVPPDEAPPFLFAAIRDDQADVNPTKDLGTELFRVTLDDDIDPDLTGYRGTAQPATAFNAAGLGRVFFVGTKFHSPNEPDPITGDIDCKSQFTSVVFALGAQTGNAAYDLSGTGDDRFVQIDDRVNAVRGAGGQIILDKGQIGSTPSQLPPPPAPFAGPSGGTGDVFVQSVRPNSAVCR